MTDPAFREHLSENAVAAYLSGGLTPLERERIESHLVVCPECRREIVAVVKLLSSHRRRVVRLSFAYLAGIIVLATVVARVVKWWHRVRLINVDARR